MLSRNNEKVRVWRTASKYTVPSHLWPTEHLSAAEAPSGEVDGRLAGEQRGVHDDL